MNSYYTAVTMGATIEETLTAIRDAPDQIENKNYVYIVNNQGKPEGVISVKDLMRTDPKKKWRRS